MSIDTTNLALPLGSNCITLEGGIPTPGQIKLQGFKHLAVVLLAAATARGCVARFDNMPNILDVEILCSIIEGLGGEVTSEDTTIIVDTSKLVYHPISDEIVNSIHGSIYLVPALLGRFGHVELGRFGGCQIGSGDHRSRPVHHVCEVLRRFGADMSVQNDRIIGKADCFKACELDIMEFSDYDDVLSGPMISGATKTAILASMHVRAGRTVIHNYYFKPDVLELIAFMEQLGFKVERDEKKLVIEGCAAIEDACTFRLLPDLNEIMTYICLGVYSGVELQLADPMISQSIAALAPEMEYLRSMGVNIYVSEDSVLVQKVGSIKGIDIKVTSVGIYSDHQPFFCVMALLGSGNTTISEQVWTDRFDYVTELHKLGVATKREGNRLTVIPGLPTRANQTLNGTDLRGVVALIIASLLVKGRTTIYGVTHLKRGYEDFIGVLQSMGIQISC